jgi:hypothetical protein
MNQPYQRLGSISNAQVGNDFELLAQRFFGSQGIELERNYVAEIGIEALKKPHAFDLGCKAKKWLVECKSHRWTTGHNVPSAKLTVWNEAMYYFYAAPSEYKKVLFVLRDLRRGTGESLANYYVRMYGHLVPLGVELWEYDESTQLALKINIQLKR